MATASNVKSVSGTTTLLTEDIVKLTQFWDRIEVENRHATEAMWVLFGGGAATAGGAGTDFVGPGDSKVFSAGIISEDGIPGNSTTNPCHWVSVIGSANPYTVSGIAGKF